MLRALVLALALAACASAPKPAPPPPTLPPNLHPPTEESCDHAQVTLERLDCRREDGSSWAKTPRGAPFAEACKHALRDGRPWMSNCLSRITDCSLIDRAFRGAWCGGAE